MARPSPFGRRLRQWRRVRRMSQLDLAGVARSTTRYISFLENGRSRPSEQMVHRLADALGITVRERNELLVSAGFAAAAARLEGPPSSEVGVRPFSQIVTRVIESHAPYPAIVVNRWWDVVNANESAARFLTLVDPTTQATNMIEWLFGASDEMRARFEDWPETAYSFLRRIRREMVDGGQDDRLEQMVAFAEDKVAGFEPPPYELDEAVKCPTVHVAGTTLRLVGMVARFGSAREVSLDELRVELLYPRDDATAAFFEELADDPRLRLAR